MAKRRPAGDGMVRRRPNGKWEGRIVVGHKADGSSIFRYVYADTQKALTAKLRQSIDAYQGVDLTEGSRMTLEAWLDKWLDEYMAATLRPGTLDGYRRDMENHVKPHLGHKPLDKLTAQDLRRLYDALLDHGRLREDGVGPGLSPSTVHGIHATLHHALKAAVGEGLIAGNPADHVAPPKVQRKPPKVLTADQLEVFLAAIEDDEIWHDFFYTELTTGLRRGELCGLRWEDFDSDAGALEVRRTIHSERGGALTAGNPKTYASTRKIVLPPSTAALLRERKKMATSAWIFPDLFHPDRPTSPGSAYRRLKQLLPGAGLPDIRFHDLRHTFATHALASGVDARTLSDILGHTKSSFTLDTYTHTTGHMQKAAAELIGGYLTEILGEELKPWLAASTATAASG